MKAHNKAFQKQLLFRFDAKRKRNCVTGRGLRSSVEVDMLTNDATFNVKTTNFKELHRYVLEDVLGCDQDHPLLLCVSKELDGDLFSGMLSEGVITQIKNGTGGDMCKISGKTYYNLTVTMHECRAHQRLIAGTMQMLEFEWEYRRREGFSVRIDGTDLILPFKWPQLVNFPEDMSVDVGREDDDSANAKSKKGDDVVSPFAVKNPWVHGLKKWRKQIISQHVTLGRRERIAKRMLSKQ
mmetsp:Transcript_35557/g.74958  ORF Transcript_35557/g.74958 Transcript_35557/m.74958 type:complete len:239 (+) Transcript_35557:493-1209(+)